MSRGLGDVYKRQLVLIPFVDDFINQISEDEIYMTLPDGLLDIN